ncbi:DNA-3-methyladenine glycosylase I, partial [Rhizobium leguminosarum]|uniref:DNA-3-methyladenine glycosylase I n=1 Tax=Rhizobium leguminosarum TaxID=384 RepID=UPI003F95C5C9
TTVYAFMQAIGLVNDHLQGCFCRPERAMMVGNSMKSDIVTAIAAGSYGVFVPHELTWVMEHVDEPKEAPRFRKIG